MQTAPRTQRSVSTNRRPLGVIFLTVFVDLVGFGIVLPILPYYAQRFGVAGFGFGALIGAFSLMQFGATVVLGRLSDRVGRRPVILTSILVGAVGYVGFALASRYWVLLVARMVSGLAAGNLSVAQAYIADVTPPERRSRGMGLVGAAFGLGFIVGPALGGLAGHFGGPAAAGFVAAGLCIANFTSALFTLRESLAEEHRVERPLLDVEHLVRGIRERRYRPAFTAYGLFPFAFSGYMVAFPLLAATEFGWGEKDLGIYFTLVGIVAATVQGYLFGRLAKRFPDRTLALAGFLGLAAGIGVVPFIHHVGTLYAWVVVLAGSNSLALPSLTGIVSNLAGVTEQGAMLGAAQSLSALGRFSGPFVFGQVYDAVSPRAAFFAAAGVIVVTWLVALRLPRAAGPAAPPASTSVRAAP